MNDKTGSLDWPPPVEGTRLSEAELRPPRPPGVVRRFWARHPRLADILIALAYWLPAVGFVLLMTIADAEPVTPGPLIAGIAVLTLGAGALLFRRSRPWIPIIAAWIATLAAAPLLEISDMGLIPFALYGVAIYGRARNAWIAYGVSVPVAAVATVIAGPRTSVDTGAFSRALDGGVPASILMAIVVLIAINIGNRRRYVSALIDRAARLERERVQLAQLAALDERSRIAREMHDIVSHSLTVMVTLAEGSAAIAPDDAERAQDGMRRVAETGRSALSDMRRMLGVLAETGEGGTVAELAPQPGVVDLHTLVERFRTAGLPVRFVTRGAEPTDPAAQLAVYRIVQESLTNVLKHADSPTAVDVDVRFRRATTTIDVTDDGAATTAAASSDGHGLVGMRERVAIYGGTLTSGPAGTRGWRVHASLNHDRNDDV